MVLLWAGSGSLALAKEVSLSPDLGGEDTSKLGDFPVPDLKITLQKEPNFYATPTLIPMYGRGAGPGGAI